MTSASNVVLLAADDGRDVHVAESSIRVASNLHDLLEINRASPVDMICIDARGAEARAVGRLALLQSLPQFEQSRIVALCSHGVRAERLFLLCNGFTDCVSSIAELESLVRRSGVAAERSGRLRYGDLELDTQQYKVWRSGRLIGLPALQFRLLQFLMSNPTKVFSRAELLEQVWHSNRTNEGAVVACMARLRRALSCPGMPELIRNARGGGYALDCDADLLNAPSPRRARTTGNKSVTGASPQCHSGGLAGRRPGG